MLLVVFCFYIGIVQIINTYYNKLDIY